jgi:hypothetical protein
MSCMWEMSERVSGQSVDVMGQIMGHSVVVMGQLQGQSANGELEGD